jgi:hypothetical protein
MTDFKGQKQKPAPYGIKLYLCSDFEILDVDLYLKIRKSHCYICFSGSVFLPCSPCDSFNFRRLLYTLEKVYLSPYCTIIATEIKYTKVAANITT